MDTEEESIKFLQEHMDTTFKDIMHTYIVKDLYWMDDDPNNIRAIANMFHPENNSLNNLVVLFPPFHSSLD